MRIGFIGLGIMGKAMARNLLKGGHSLVVYDIVPALADALVADGAERADSSAGVARSAEVIITMLPDGPEVELAVLRPEGSSGGCVGRFHVDRHEFHQPLGVAENWRGLFPKGRGIPGCACQRR